MNNNSYKANDAIFIVLFVSVWVQQCGCITDVVDVEVWVKNLVTCCCFVDNFTVQSSAISTMLDLIILTQSLQMDNTAGHQSVREGTVSIQIQPTLHYHDLHFITAQTDFFKVYNGKYRLLTLTTRRKSTQKVTVYLI